MIAFANQAFNNPNSQTVDVTVNTSGTVTFTVTYTVGNCTGQDSLTFVLTDDVTVVGWIDGANISLPAGANPDLVSQLNTPSQCGPLVGSWAAAGLGGPLTPVRVSVTSNIDRQYADAYLNKSSFNLPPPQTIPDPSGLWNVSDEDFRVYNRFRTYYEVSPVGGIAWPTFQNLLESVVINGPTPDPCRNVGPVASEAGLHNGLKGSSTGQRWVYQVAEARIGSVGQAVNTYLNRPMQSGIANYRSVTPFIWSSIQFNQDGSLQPFFPQINIQMFPTYYVYRNGVLVQKFDQDPNLQMFIGLNATSMFLVP